MSATCAACNGSGRVGIAYSGTTFVEWLCEACGGLGMVAYCENQTLAAYSYPPTPPDAEEGEDD